MFIFDEQKIREVMKERGSAGKRLRWQTGSVEC
jgi:hypothetical protein